MDDVALARVSIALPWFNVSCCFVSFLHFSPVFQGSSRFYCYFWYRILLQFRRFIIYPAPTSLRNRVNV